MAYLVNVSWRAERDLEDLYHEINADESDAALIWYRGLREAIFSLGKFPNRGTVTPEDTGLRHLLYGNKPHVYRVIYEVVEKQKRVEVLHIRHGRRQRFDRR
jgi:plasmid stabilization system protein ParE